MFKFNFIPSQTDDLNYLWEMVSERNGWFIKLRYAASLMLIVFWAYIFKLSDAEYHIFQLYAVFLLAIFILLYNLYLDRLQKSGAVKDHVDKFNPLKFALLQMMLDLTALLFLVYITGIMESPFYFFFIFHAIIGSMILAGNVVYLIFISVLVIVSFLSISGHVGLIPVMSLFPPNGHTFSEVLLSLSVFWIMMILSVMFANNLASALFKREQQLILAERDKQRYVNTIVHELKSPVAVMASYIDVVADQDSGNIGEKSREFLFKARQRASDMLDMINEILEMSSVDLVNGQHFEDVELSEVITNVMSELKIKIESKNLEIESRCTAGEKFITDGNKRMLHLCFLNIIGNAVKYTPRDGKILCKFSRDNENLTVEIEDNGMGISQDDIEKIFLEFHRGKNARRSGVEGTGLGLTTVKKVIIKHHGEIYIESPSSIGNREFPGTKVVVMLPCLRIE